jgi:hypothetical protein
MSEEKLYTFNEFINHLDDNDTISRNEIIELKGVIPFYLNYSPVTLTQTFLRGFHTEKEWIEGLRFYIKFSGFPNYKEKTKMSEEKLYTFNEILEFFLVHKVISEQQVKQIKIYIEKHSNHTCPTGELLRAKSTDIKWAKDIMSYGDMYTLEIPELKNYKRILIPKEPAQEKSIVSYFRSIEID